MRSTEQEQRLRRVLIGGVTIVLLGGALVGVLTGATESIAGSPAAAEFATAAMVRVGLVCGALWLAWDSLRRPARWLPPGLALAGVMSIVLIAAQPRLILVVGPALGMLAAIGYVLRFLRPQ